MQFDSIRIELTIDRSNPTLAPPNDIWILATDDTTWYLVPSQGSMKNKTGKSVFNVM